MRKSGWIILLLVVAALVVLLVIGGGNDTTDTVDVDRPTSTDDTGMAAGDDMVAAEDSVLVGGEPMLTTRTIVENAQNAPNLTTLVSAVEAAGLVETLSGEGPFTVFAPTNEAFDALPDGTLDTLLQPENQDQLSSILTYHVVAENLSAAELMEMDSVTTVNGEELTLSSNADGELMVNGEAMVQTADAVASNGVVHVIDAVLMPSGN